MTSEFKTLEEAEKSKARCTPCWFCPLVNGYCRADCVCYKSAYVQEHNVGEYSVIDGYCNNRMLNGD